MTEQQNNETIYGVFCEYFNDCGHWLLRYLTFDQSEANKKAKGFEALSTFSKVVPLKIGEFVEIVN